MTEQEPSRHPAIEPGRVAVVTGGASGIGLAAAQRFAALGLKVAIADLPGKALDGARAAVAARAPDGDRQVLAVGVDVSRPEEVDALRDAVLDRFGEVAILMNNAGIEAGGRFDSPLETWRRILDVNLWGALHGLRAFLDVMRGSGRPGAVINTGSKQGITTPPGNTPYNVSKAGLKVLTEALAHELRQDPGCRISAHLLIPGFVYTGLTRRRGVTEKPDAAWTPDETVAFMLEALGRGDFYVLCPDNDVTREMDERRIRWAAEDVASNRPALSRWHSDHAAAFSAYMREAPLV